MKEWKRGMNYVCLSKEERCLSKFGRVFSNIIHPKEGTNVSQRKCIAFWVINNHEIFDGGVSSKLPFRWLMVVSYFL